MGRKTKKRGSHKTKKRGSHKQRKKGSRKKSMRKMKRGVNRGVRSMVKGGGKGRRGKLTKKEENRILSLHDKAKGLSYELDEKHQQELMRETAAKNIQRLTRGRQSRKRHPPRDRPMDDDLIKRITNLNIMGTDADKIRNELEELLIAKEKDEETLQRFDRNKYNIGEQYIFPQKKIYQIDVDDEGYPLPKHHLQEEILKKNAKDKNREALLDIHKKEYERLSESVAKEGAKMDPYPTIEKVEEEILENDYIPRYIYDPEIIYGKKASDKGDWEDTLKSLYGKEPIPKLVPLDEVDYERDDFSSIYPHKPEKIEELKDYYNKYNDILITKNLFNKGKDHYFGEGESLDDLLMEELKYYDTPTIYSCMNIKEQVETNKKLYNDKGYLNKMIKPCKENILLTEVYIMNFENLPLDFILSSSSFDQHLINALDYSSNGTKLINRELEALLAEEGDEEAGGRRQGWDEQSLYFPDIIRSEMIKILEDMGIYKQRGPMRSAREHIIHTDDGPLELYKIGPVNTLYLLAIIFKCMKANEEVYIKFKDLSVNPFVGFDGIYISPIGLSGIDALRIFFDRLEEYYNEVIRRLDEEGDDHSERFRPGYSTRAVLVEPKDVRIPDGFNIEKTKRYFILLLIGVVGTDPDTNINFRHSLNKLEESINIEYSRSLDVINSYYKGERNPTTGKTIRLNIDPKGMAAYKILVKRSEWKLKLIQEFREIHTHFIKKKYHMFDPYGDDEGVNVDTLFYGWGLDGFRVKDEY